MLALVILVDTETRKILANNASILQYWRKILALVILETRKILAIFVFLFIQNTSVFCATTAGAREPVYICREREIVLYVCTLYIYIYRV